MNLFKNEKGIGLIAFIIIFVLIILIIGAGIFFSKKAIIPIPIDPAMSFTSCGA